MYKAVGLLGFILLCISINYANANGRIATESTDNRPIKTSTVNTSLEQLNNLTSLPLAHGSFEQRKYFTVLKQPIVSTGEVYLDQALGFVWQTLYPISSVLRLKKSGLFMQDEVSSEREVKGAATITEVLMNALSGNVDALQNEFSFEPSIRNNCIRLLPKENLLANVMQAIDLCMVDNKLNGIVLFEHSGNRTEIDITLSALTKLPEAISAQLQ
jgi:hypothetical protein